MSNFIWYDLMTPDMVASSEFYAHVVGWTIKDSGMPGMTYSVISANGIDVGGIMPIPPSSEGMPACWNGYIYSSEVDKDAERANELGGKIYQPGMDIPGVGRFAVLGDPSGAAFIIFKPNSNESPTKIPDGTPGHVGWRELMSADWQKDFDFYAAMFGWRKTEAMDMGPMGIYQLFDMGNGQSGGMMNKTPQDPAPPHWNYYINVDSIAAGVARAKSKGATFFMEPMEVPGGGFATSGMDPQGAAFSLFSSAK
jgi:predicted enzyme related to lactoylglutathione lyase